MMFESSVQISSKSFQSSEAVSNPAFEISAEIVDKLLDKLSSDNEFRDVFLKSPRIALAYLGHEGATNASPGDVGLWVCARCSELASPEVIKTTRSKMRLDLLTSLAKQQPVTLNIAKKSS